MDISIAEAREQLADLIKIVQEGRKVLITDDGKPVAELAPPPPPPLVRKKVVFGGMADRIKLLPGWDDPMDEEDFLQGEP